MKTTFAPAPPAAAIPASDSQFALDAPPPAAPAVRRIPGLPEPTTPLLLWAAVAMISLAAILLFAASSGAVRQSRNALQNVGKNCAPSIIAAQTIRAALADLDANLVNLLIVDSGFTEKKNAEKAVAKRRVEIAQSLVYAAENITFGDKERVPITTMVRDLGLYETLMSRAGALKEKGDIAGSMKAARDGGRLIRETLIPAADALDEANNAVLERAFDDASRAYWRQLAFLIFAGAALTAGLVMAQVWIARRTRRRLNPSLVIATAITVAFTVQTVSAVVRSAEDLRVATKDAFESVHYLWTARAIANDANAAESRWLYDRTTPSANVEELHFKDSAARIAKLPAGMTFDRLVGVFTSMGRDLKPVPGFEGLLSRELSNITFPGEREAAIETLRRWGVYVGIDGQIRRSERGGDHAGAISLCLSDAPSGSNGSFDRFHSALGETLAINQRVFDASLASGQSTLAGLDGIASIAMLFTAALALVGIWPRLKEYAE